MLEALPYPRYYLDFETISFAVPRWAGTSPYRSQIPFQWSCHVEVEVGELQHFAFLDTSGHDPRRAFAVQLIDALRKAGPVFVYNQSFEKSRITELAEQLPELSADLTAINSRNVDLLPIARYHYYHPAMKGSWSIKAVLPTIAPDLDYHRLLVGNGSDAQAAYLEITHPRTSPERRAELVEALDAYCALDTLAMVRLAWFLQHIDVYLFAPQTARRLTEGPGGIRGQPEGFADALRLLDERCRKQSMTMIVLPVSLLQRTLRIGYRHALLLREHLEGSGVLLRLPPPQTHQGRRNSSDE